MLTSQAVIDEIRWVVPDFRNNHDKVVFAVHAAFHNSGFDLTATGCSAFADYALSSPSQVLVGINGWNEFDKDYAFVYMNKKTSKKYLVKCLAMDDYLLVDALADGGVDVPHLEIEVGNYTTESSDVREMFKNLDKLVNDLNSESLYKLDATLKPVSSSVVVSRVVDGDPGSRTRTRTRRGVPHPGARYPYGLSGYLDLNKVHKAATSSKKGVGFVYVSRT